MKKKYLLNSLMLVPYFLGLGISNQYAYAEGARPDKGQKVSCVISYGTGQDFINSEGNVEIARDQYYWTPAVEGGGGFEKRDCGKMPDLSFLKNLSGSNLEQTIKDLEQQNGKNSEQDNRLDKNEAKNKEQDNRLNDHDREIGDIKNKNTEQDKRLDGNDKEIKNINNKNTEQDNRLNGHDREIGDIKNKNTEQDKRLDEHGNKIQDLNDNAVFYDRDENGKKTGNVTLDAGTGQPVGLGNVANGKSEHDATNVGQLQGALDGLGGGAKVNPDGSITGPTYEIGGKEYTNVSEAIKAQNKLGVQYVSDKEGNPTNHVILSGDGKGAEVRISNVADGRTPNDAANMRQLNNVKKESFSYTDYRVDQLKAETDQRFSALSSDLSDLRSEARSGIAMANAFAGMRFDDNPGRGTIAAAFGGFKSTTAMALGVGYTTDDGIFRINAGLAHSFNSSDLSWNGGMSWSF